MSRVFDNKENEHWTLCTMTGSVVMILRRIPLEKKSKKIASLENFTRKKMSSEPSLYYKGYGSYGCPKNFLKEVEKIIASLEN